MATERSTERVPEGITLPEIAKRAGADYRTLKNWVERGLVTPSVRATNGAGNPGLYSERDAAILCKMAELRRRGLDLDHIEVVARLFATHDQAACTVCGGTIALASITEQGEDREQEAAAMEEGQRIAREGGPTGISPERSLPEHCDLTDLLRAVEPFTVDGGISCGSNEVDALVEIYDRITTEQGEES